MIKTFKIKHNKDLKERLNAKINSYLSVGRQGGKYDEEWIREEDQIEMREDLYNFILLYSVSLIFAGNFNLLFCIVFHNSIKSG